MVEFVLLLAACIGFSYAGAAIKEMYKPSKKLEDLLLTAFLLLTLTTQLATIYFTAKKSPFFSMIEIIAFDYYWFIFAPYYPHSDPAGNGMALGFRSIFNTVASFLFGLISFFLIKFWAYDSRQTGLHIVLFLAACIGLKNLFNNRNSFLSGDSFEESARWAKMSKEEYRKSLFRAGMLEKIDLWEAKELDASPEELKHWDVYGCKSIKVRTHKKLNCLLLEGSCEFPNETADLNPSGLLCGCLGYTDDGDVIDTSSFVPKYVKLAWHDISDGKTYRVYTSLPKELDHYFDDTERFGLDDIEFRIMPRGKVLMFHNMRNQIHNIMIDYPLQGEVTNDYEQEFSNLISEYKIDVNEYRATKVPSLDTINDYMKRFKYQLVFCIEKDSLKITKTICNFFNGEKILSDGVWKENMEPARIKDVFIRYESEQHRYAAFIYFNENEVLETFYEAYNKCDESLQGEFIIQVGTLEKDFSFALKLGDKRYHLKRTEIRLYKINSDDAGKLVLKNYKRNHKNILAGLEVQ
ncbi:hypothetical protein [Ruminococcus flavefaciens]|uniref:hypothetical protein n=1 Tax=Ruminococcus flavefaciens TaxID=1265 RepID=UPI000464BAB3|nr:hypothetical protein [Ruminococcus flavefaciens]